MEYYKIYYNLGYLTKILGLSKKGAITKNNPRPKNGINKVVSGGFELIPDLKTVVYSKLEVDDLEEEFKKIKFNEELKENLDREIKEKINNETVWLALRKHPENRWSCYYLKGNPYVSGVGIQYEVGDEIELRRTGFFLENERERTFLSPNDVINNSYYGVRHWKENIVFLSIPEYYLNIVSGIFYNLILEGGINSRGASTLILRAINKKEGVPSGQELTRDIDALPCPPNWYKTK